MPLSGTSKKVKKEMQEQYGKEKGESVFYATANKKGGPAEEASTWKKKIALCKVFNCPTTNCRSETARLLVFCVRQCCNWSNTLANASKRQ